MLEMLLHKNSNTIQPVLWHFTIERETAAMIQEDESNNKDASLKDIALAELVSYIFERQ